MGRIKILATEINDDPLILGYAVMSNTEVVTSMNAPTRSRNKSSISSQEVLEAIDPAALMLLSGDQATRVWGILGMPSFDPFGVAAEIMKDAFGAQSSTLAALASLRVESISRAQELGYQGLVKEGHVEQARAKLGV